MLEPTAEVRKDLRTLATFIRVYCKHKHPDAAKSPPELKTLDLPAILGTVPPLCEECRKLLAHSFIKRSTCPMEPKPACKHCPNHCYHPDYRARIRDVMKFSGRKMVLSGRLDLLYHLLF